MTNTKPNGEATQEFTLQRIYLKDTSFEAPNTPQIFRAEWQPEISLELQTHTESLGEDSYEVVLGVTVTAKLGDKVAFLVEVKQAGVFTIKGFTESQIPEVLGIACPGILFPYSREVVSSLIAHGTFPQLLLDPINFEGLYRQQQQAAIDAQQVAETPATH
ncbi:MAG: protein-export chaperone SecB [Gammaproteobacteria bacterium]